MARPVRLSSVPPARLRQASPTRQGLWQVWKCHSGCPQKLLMAGSVQENTLMLAVLSGLAAETFPGENGQKLS